MKELALKYYDEGYNCSQCILKAAEAFFCVSVPDECCDMCSAVGNGFGVGVFCCALAAGTMVFGLMFDEKTAKRLRIKLLYEFSMRYEHINCSQLKKENESAYYCDKLISGVAGLVCDLIIDELEKRNRL